MGVGLQMNGGSWGEIEGQDDLCASYDVCCMQGSNCQKMNWGSATQQELRGWKGHNGMNRGTGGKPPQPTVNLNPGCMIKISNRTPPWKS